LIQHLLKYIVTWVCQLLGMLFCVRYIRNYINFGLICLFSALGLLWIYHYTHIHWSHFSQQFNKTQIKSIEWIPDNNKLQQTLRKTTKNINKTIWKLLLYIYRHLRHRSTSPYHFHQAVFIFHIRRRNWNWKRKINSSLWKQIFSDEKMIIHIHK